MDANLSIQEITDAAVQWLRDRLPQNWEAVLTNRPVDGGLPQGDAIVEVRGPGSYSPIVIESKRSFQPSDLRLLTGSLVRSLRGVSRETPILIVAPWLSERTQSLLEAEGLNYLDLTGNALLQLNNPAVFISSQGSSRDPEPKTRGKARVQGPKAGRLIRALCDFLPPYGVTELARLASLNPGYVSRLLETLDEEALVLRSRRGAVESVEISPLITRWSQSYDVFKSNRSKLFVAQGSLVSILSSLPLIDQTFAVTGSFAAARLAPVTGPGLLSVYVENADAAAERLELLPSQTGGNVVLLTPFDPVIWARTTTADIGIDFVAPSQAAVDCLTGNGRMPAEGEALLRWMTDNEESWRLKPPKLASL